MMTWLLMALGLQIYNLLCILPKPSLHTNVNTCVAGQASAYVCTHTNACMRAHTYTCTDHTCPNMPTLIHSPPKNLDTWDYPIVYFQVSTHTNVYYACAVDLQLSRPQVSSLSSCVMTVQLGYFVKMCVLLEYLNGALFINASVI